MPATNGPVPFASATDAPKFPPASASGSAPRTSATSETNLNKRNELLHCMRNNQLVVVLGTGVSLQTVGHPGTGTAVAGWVGLLEHGLAHCGHHQLITPADAGIVDLQIKAGTTERLIDAAQIIHDCLAKRENQRYFWLKESVGQLVAKDPRLIRAIEVLGGAIATLNYDGLISQVTRRPPLHWRQQSEITRFLRFHRKDYTLHMHGYWEDPDSVVLDRKSYEAIKADLKMRSLLNHLARFETMLFIGCRQTFFDPNFQAWLDWAHNVLEGEKQRHYILCRSSEEADLLKELQPHGYLVPLVYGDTYEDLVPFLDSLASESAGVVPSNPPAMATSPIVFGATGHVRKPVEVWKLQSHR